MPISSSCEAYLHLKGVIDVKKETERLLGKKEKAEGWIKKLLETMDAADYSEKVPVDVREANSEKLRQYEAELNKVAEAIKTISLID